LALPTGGEPSVPPVVREALQSSAGRPLEAGVRAFFEPRLGHDLGGVRVHVGAHAARSADAVNALAYTVGQDIVFGAGRYDPSSNAGRGLLGHELAHVLQQRGRRSADSTGHPGPWPPADAALQRAETGEVTDGNEWIERMRALREVALAGKMTGDEERAFVAGLNEVIEHSPYSTKSGIVLPVEPVPGRTDLEAGHVYFDKSEHGGPGITRSLCKPLSSSRTGYTAEKCRADLALGDAIFLGPDVVQDTVAYTRSVFEHEAVHYFLGWYRQNVPGDEDAPAMSPAQQRYDEEVLGYAEEFVRIFEMSRSEMEATVHLWMKYYSVANESARADSDQWVKVNLREAHARTQPDPAALRTVVEEGKTWAAQPQTLKDPGQLSRVVAAADLVIATLDELTTVKR
jgi:hypothetical protein